MELRKVADAGFTDSIAGSDKRRLPLCAGAENPFDNSVGAVEPAKCCDADTIRKALIGKQVALIGFMKRMFFGQVLNERTFERRHHSVRHTSVLVGRGFARVAAGTSRGTGLRGREHGD